MSTQSLRLAVTGLKGQVVSALIARAPKNVEIIALGRPQLELSRREAVMTSLRHAECDAIINAAAYTQVDKAEAEPEVAMAVNGLGTENVAQAAAALGVPLLHISTDYVFDGLLDRAYREIDPVNPQTAYGKSKLVGEEKVRATHKNHIILRTAWVYSPFSANFVKTMLRLGAERDEISVVSDQKGNPSSACDIADILISIAHRLVRDPSDELRGVFHMTGKGEANWAEFAEEILAIAEQRNYRRVRVNRISSTEYPTAAQRPQNSRLDNSKLREIFGVELPEWRHSVYQCVDQLLRKSC